MTALILLTSQVKDREKQQQRQGPKAQCHQQLQYGHQSNLVGIQIKLTNKYICPTDIHHSNQKPSSTCMLCTTSHTFVYNQCPQLKNLTGTCQKQHQCVINTLKSGDFLHELQVLFGVAPRDDTRIYPDIGQWQKKIASLLLDILYIDFLLHFFLSKVLLVNTLRFRQKMTRV